MLPNMHSLWRVGRGRLHTSHLCIQVDVDSHILLGRALHVAWWLGRGRHHISHALVEVLLSALRPVNVQGTFYGVWAEAGPHIPSADWIEVSSSTAMCAPRQAHTITDNYNKQLGSQMLNICQARCGIAGNQLFSCCQFGPRGFATLRRPSNEGARRPMSGLDFPMT